MVYLSRGQSWTIVLVAVFSILYALPNILPASAVSWMSAHLPHWMPTQTVNLGLDLRGGSHLLLEVQTAAVTKDQLDGLVDQVRSELRKAKIGYTDLAAQDNTVRVTIIESADIDKARDVFRAMDREVGVTADGNGFKLTYSEQAVKDKIKSAMEQTVEIVRRRIDQTGTREPSIQRQGDDRILVQLPGIDNPEGIKHLLGQTAKLSFRFVDDSASPTDVQAGRLVLGADILPMAEDPTRKIPVSKRVMVSGDMLTDAQASFQNNEPVVSFKFNSIGARRFGEATRDGVGKLFAIVLDDKVISAPVIREPILGGSGVISGSFTTESANELAILLRAGALPAPIQVLEERTVGPGLGADSIEYGKMAAIIGTSLVVVFMFLCYGLFGVFANIALALNIIMIFALLSLLQATLTLPGIAGILLTIGTAVDANVLIFERIREEMRLGRTSIAAIDAGYSRAMSAIMDANVTTLIATFLLYCFGSGPIKGFAVTLTIGILTSLFSAIMVTRLMVASWYQAKRPKLLPL